MKRNTVFVLALASLLGLLALAPLGAWAETAKPGEGIVLSVDSGSIYRPGELVEIHFFVTDNGTLAVPTWPIGFPHVHPPNIEDTGGTADPDTGDVAGGLIPLPTPVQYGHVGAYRTSLEAPDAPGLYAIHGAAVVNGVQVFAFGSFQVVGADLLVEVNVAPVYRPGETVEVHIFTTYNGALVEPEWAPFGPHVHPPDLPGQGLINLDEPQIYGHDGAYRTSFTGPSVVGLYAVHISATVGNASAFGFAEFQVVQGLSDPEAVSAAMSAMTWALGGLGVSVLVLIVAVAILLRQRKAA